MQIKSQSTLEYAFLVVVLVAVIVGMNLYIRRSVQANLKLTETRLNSIDWIFISGEEEKEPHRTCVGDGQPCGGRERCCPPLKCINGICQKILK